MKKCPKCGKEFPDESLFCSSCGEKLEGECVCQNCGHPIKPNDAFCSHCGHKIEKEYHCPNCHATISEQSKFCPECGHEIDQPLVGEVKRSNAPRHDNVKDYINKGLFFFICVSLIITGILTLIGCFGDIWSIDYNTGTLGTPSTSENIKTGISYFFGDAVEDIKTTAGHLKHYEYRSNLIATLIFDYIFWISAIVMTIAGIGMVVYQLYKSTTTKEYVFKDTFPLIASLSSLPYLFFFAMRNSAYLEGVNAASASYIVHVTMSSTFGWGTTMILVSTIISFCLIGLYKVGMAITSKKDIVGESVFFVVKTVFFVVFLFAMQQSVRIYYSTASNKISGYMTSYSIYTANLESYSSDTIKSVPSYATNCLIGSILLFVSGIIGTIMFSTMKNRKDFIPYAISSVILLGLALTGYIMCYNGTTKAASEGIVNSLYAGIPEGSIHYSSMGVVLPIIAVLSVVGAGFARFFKSEQQA